MTIPPSEVQRQEARSVIASTFVLPVLNGVMHIPPAIGAMWAALGRRGVIDLPVLVLLFALHVVIDGMKVLAWSRKALMFSEPSFQAVTDKYVDLPYPARLQWSKRIALFASVFVGLIGYTTYLCGVFTLLHLLFVPALAVMNATPSIPVWSRKYGKLQFIKLKDMLDVFKSCFGALCIGLMDTTAIVQHICTTHPNDCGSKTSRVRQAQALAYTILYDFLLETVFDLRDIEEDRRHHVRTLPAALGRGRTLLLLVAVVNFGDPLITGVILDPWGAAECMLRATLVWAFFACIVLKRRRSDTATWGLLTLVGLLPAWWAQARLL